MNYPLDMRFKLLALAPQVTVTDSTGKLLMYVRQKLFKLKEHVTVFADLEQTRPLFEIKADRMIDFSANYSFTASDGQPWGSVRRRGARSLFKAHYEIIQDGRVDMELAEESVLKRIMEATLGQIPLVGMLFVMLINPSYIISRPDGTPLLKLTKLPAFFEGKFKIEKLNDLPEDDEVRSLLAIIMAALLERSRG